MQRREGDEWVFVRGDLSGWEASGEVGGAMICFPSSQFLVRPRQTVEASPGVLGLFLVEPQSGEHRVALGVEL